MKVFIQSVLLSALGLISSFSYAEPSVSVGTQISTLGAGINLGYQINPTFDIKANINGLNLHHTFDTSDINYASKIQLFSAGLLASYHPFQNGFHLTGGLYYNDNSIFGNGVFAHNYQLNYGKHVLNINPNEYGSMSFKAKYSPISPYLGLGYNSSQNKKGLGWAVDVGVLYQGSARINYDTPAIFNTFASKDIERNKQEIQNKANKLRWFPVASIGLFYKF